jgi:hypothetical protein
MQLCRSLLVPAVFTEAVDLVAARLTQPRAVTQHLAQSQRLVGAMAELSRAVQVMVVLAAAVVTTILAKESLSVLRCKVIPVADLIRGVTVLAVAVAVQEAWVAMRLRNIVAAPEVLEFRR